MSDWSPARPRRAPQANTFWPPCCPRPPDPDGRLNNRVAEAIRRGEFVLQFMVLEPVSLEAGDDEMPAVRAFGTRYLTHVRTMARPIPCSECRPGAGWGDKARKAARRIRSRSRKFVRLWLWKRMNDQATCKVCLGTGREATEFWRVPCWANDEKEAWSWRSRVDVMVRRTSDSRLGPAGMRRVATVEKARRRRQRRGASSSPAAAGAAAGPRRKRSAYQKWIDDLS